MEQANCEDKNIFMAPAIKTFTLSLALFSNVALHRACNYAVM
jgi:hypothetical protein